MLIFYTNSGKGSSGSKMSELGCSFSSGKAYSTSSRNLLGVSLSRCGNFGRAIMFGSRSEHRVNILYLGSNSRGRGYK